MWPLSAASAPAAIDGMSLLMSGSFIVDTRLGSLWYVIVWYLSNSWDVMYVSRCQAASMFVEFLGMPTPQPPRNDCGLPSGRLVGTSVPTALSATSDVSGLKM